MHVGTICRLTNRNARNIDRKHYQLYVLSDRGKRGNGTERTDGTGKAKNGKKGKTRKRG
jgi:hypothetical protein